MFEHILVPLDGSQLAECVLPHAVALARAFDAHVTLLRVLGHSHPSDRSQTVDPLEWYILKAEAKAYLDEVTNRFRKAALRTESGLVEGPPAERIVEFASSQDVDLILLGSHGRSGLSGWNISSVVQKVILRAHVPTMIVRAYQRVPGDLEGLRYRHVLVPLDGSQRAECVLPLASTLSRYHESRLLFAQVVSRPEMPHRAPLTQEEAELANQITERNRLEAARYLEQLHLRLSVDAETRLLVSDDIAASLHNMVAQEQVDLVLLSAHGYSGGTRWPYGSIALNFIAYGTSPLLIVQDLSRDEMQRTQMKMVTRGHKGH